MCCPHRLVGLGHRPFTATTGVRIPLGMPSNRGGNQVKTAQNHLPTFFASDHPSIARVFLFQFNSVNTKQSYADNKYTQWFVKYNIFLSSFIHISALFQLNTVAKS